MNKIIFSYTYIHIIVAIVSTVVITSCNSEAVKERPLQLSKQNNNTENKFVKSDGDTDSNQNNGTVLSFEKPRVSEAYSLNVTYTQAAKKTTVADDTGAITYTSSNTNIAQVNAKTGEVRFVTAGTVIITATKAATPNKYKHSTAQYTLYITYKPISKINLVAEIKSAIEKIGNTVDLNYIDTSDITDMSKLFHNSDFNGDISQWNISNVTDMTHMFDGAKAFNQDISEWNVLNVTDMTHMFYNAKAFNQDISEWNVSQVTDMSAMFGGASAFRSDISEWNVSKVTDMRSMFYGARVFRGDTSKWNVSQVTDMSAMFYGARAFNSDISRWDISRVTDMSYMFTNAFFFMQDLGSWHRKFRPGEKPPMISNMFDKSGVRTPPFWFTVIIAKEQIASQQ